MLPRRASILVVCAFVVMAGFWACAAFWPAPYEYAEGDSATWAYLLRHGERLYVAEQGVPMHRSNYPPLFLELLARVAPSDAAVLSAGRLISLGGFLLAMAMVALSVGAATGSWRAAGLAALLLAGTFRAGFWGGVCRPDALGFGLGTVGVTVAALRVRPWPILAAVYLAAALLVKHNLVVFPAGLLAWALLDPRERRAGLLFLLLLGALVGAAVFVLDLWGPLVRDSMAPWRPLTFLRHLVTSVAPSGPALALALWLVGRRAMLSERGRRVAGPWAGVLAAGLAWTLALGRIGAEYNYLLELLAAASVLAVIAAAQGLGRRLFAAQAALALAETAAWIGCYAVLVLPPRRDEMAAAQRALADVRGPVFAEQSWYAAGAGHAPIVIPFLSAQLAAGGRWDPAPLVEVARAGRLDRVLLGFPLEEEGASRRMWHEERFAPGLLDAMRARYRLVERARDLYVYAPKP